MTQATSRDGAVMTPECTMEPHANHGEPAGVPLSRISATAIEKGSVIDRRKNFWAS